MSIPEGTQHVVLRPVFMLGHFGPTDLCPSSPAAVTKHRTHGHIQRTARANRTAGTWKGAPTTGAHGPDALDEYCHAVKIAHIEWHNCLLLES